MNTIKTVMGLCFLFGALLTAVAQDAFNPDEKLPMNPNVRYGVLDNGITYYVLHNEEPNDRASFYIVQNVGAILENDDQNGLAHFLEHMAFNGTENFPEKGILNYLESYGVAFGRNINAYTSVDETVYNISNVPTTNENLIDSTLLVLHDWTDYLLLTEEEIDSERGVIHEEWRTRRSGGMRVYLESNKYIFQGSKYAERDVIGSLDVIDNFEYETIRDFYHDWYRTDLQAIIVVGDVDVDQIEAKIKASFSEIKAIEDPKERFYVEVPENEEPIVGIVTDVEASSIRFSLYFKHKATGFDDKNLGYYRQTVLASLYSEMLGMRYNELLQKGTPPFIFAYGSYYNQARLLDVYNVGAGLSEDNIEGGIEAALIENERVLRHRFLLSELDRAKVSLLSKYEKAYQERNKMQSDQLVGEYKNHYLSNEPSPGIEYEFELMQKLLPSITVEEVSALAKKWNTENNQVYLLTGIEKEDLVYPAKDKILEIAKKVKGMQITAYEDAATDEPLIAEMPKAGKVKKETSLNDMEATHWILSNGARVILKTTDFKENEIIFDGYSVGGSSLYGAADLPSIDMMSAFIPAFGVGNFDNVNLEKKLTGKILKYNMYVNDLYEGLSGSSSVQDFETLLQLVYLQFENPRFDEESFNALKARYMAYVANMSANIDNAFADTVTMVKTDYNERTTLFNAETLAKMDFATMERIYKERFIDASDFTFVFVGNIDIEKARPLIETYIGGIESINRDEKWIDNKVSFPENDVVKPFSKPMETPKSTVYITMHGKDMEYNNTNKFLLSYVSKLLSKKYLDIIREEEGGSYGVGVRGSLSRLPEPEYQLMAKFDTDPEKCEKLKAIVYNEIVNLYKEGVDETDLEEVRSNLIKQREENLRKNGYWKSALMNFDKFDENITAKASYEDVVNSITKEQVEEFAKNYFSDASKIEVVMSPAE